VIGRDIIQHHTVFWPAMLEGADFNEPRAVMASGFVNLDGKGFSTSRNRAVWATEYLDSPFDTDLLRFYLATAGAFERDIDFSWEAFQERVNAELADDVGNFVYRALLFAARNYDGTPDVGVTARVESEIESATEEYTEALNDYSVRDAGTVPLELARFGNEYIQRNEPWKLIEEDPDRAAQVIRDTVQLAKAVAVLLQPFTPETAEQIWTDLEAEGTAAEATIEACLEAPPDAFGEPREPFEKIEDEQVEARQDALQERIEEETTAQSDEDTTDAHSMTDIEPLAEDRIGFEDFEELDIRVGRIESAEPIEGADELLRLEVDIGAETRQLVAGLRQLHDVEELPGTKTVVLANLEPTELFGVESNGMLLAAGEEADLLTTHGDAEPGTKIQ
ncbi:MAG: class I tRNA ligase family protein, partial [Halodesulfurarchaeum sp.]